MGCHHPTCSLTPLLLDHTLALIQGLACQHAQSQAILVLATLLHLVDPQACILGPVDPTPTPILMDTTHMDTTLMDPKA